MTSIQVADETFVAASPSLAGSLVNDRGRWREWWPDLALSLVEDRGDAGVRWKISGPVQGTMEIWCEAVMDGFVLHYFMHAEPTAQLPSDPDERQAELAEANRLRRVAGKQMSFQVKAMLESGREVGGPAAVGQAHG